MRRGLRVAMVAAVLAAVTAGMHAAGAGPDVDEGAVRYGGTVFQANCAACHGATGRGGSGEGVQAGPPLVDVPIAYVDLTVRTGRMPITSPRLGVLAEELDDDDREALLAYLRYDLGLEGDIPTVGPGSAMRGQELYVRNCAACHGAASTGGIVGGGVDAPSLAEVDPVAIAEAIRVGPFAMPAFSDQVLDGQQVDDIIAYLHAADDTPRSPLGLRELDEVAAAAGAAALAGVVLLLVWRLARPRGPTDPRAEDGGVVGDDEEEGA